MAKITEEMKALIKEQQAFIATASPDGTPNIAPKGSTRVLDEEYITFAESAGKTTYENIKKNPKVAIVVCDRAQMKCLRFQGKAEIITTGPLFDKIFESMKKMGAPPPQAVIKVKVDEIYDLGVPGFGKKIG
jgi:predicted pyridoxine 5'-phosphate oxidase superfamily flavin-nucleotide-binding protein